MKRFAVAFIYQELPRFDKIIFDGDSYRYYRGEVEVSLPVIHPDVPFQPGIKLGLLLVDAANRKEAMRKVADSFPYCILELTTQEVSEQLSPLSVH